jgi:hypothetical protein
VKHVRIRPRRPQTNGKVERFNRTLLEEWAYVRIYRSNHARTRALDWFLLGKVALPLLAAMAISQMLGGSLQPSPDRSAPARTSPIPQPGSSRL